LIGATYRSVVRHGGAKAWNAMVDIYRKPSSPQIKLTAMSALAYAEDPALIEKTFEFSKTDVDDGELFGLWGHLAASLKTRRTLADFMIQNWEFMDKRYEGNYTHMQRLVKIAFERLSTEEDATMLEKFFADKDTSKFSMSLAQTLESIRTRSNWRERAKGDVEQWLKNWNASSQASL